MKIKFLISIWLCMAIVGSCALGYTPLLIPVVYLLMSVLTYVIYAKDKSAAKSKSWRTPENTLHLLSLCGGWIGAAIGQEKYRHKTQKMSFLWVYWLTVVINVAAFIALHLAPLDHRLKVTMGWVNGALSDLGSSHGVLSTFAALFQYSS